MKITSLGTNIKMRFMACFVMILKSLILYMTERGLKSATNRLNIIAKKDSTMSLVKITKKTEREFNHRYAPSLPQRCGAGSHRPL